MISSSAKGIWVDRYEIASHWEAFVCSSWTTRVDRRAIEVLWAEIVSSKSESLYLSGDEVQAEKVITTTKMATRNFKRKGLCVLFTVYPLS